MYDQGGADPWRPPIFFDHPSGHVGSSAAAGLTEFVEENQ